MTMFKVLMYVDIRDVVKFSFKRCMMSISV